MNLNKEIEWSKVKRKASDIDKLQIIDKNTSKVELDRRIRAFNIPAFPLELDFHGKRFILKDINETN